MSPDLSLANALNAAPAFQIPGSEPVEIFQAELFTILEQLASGATTLSAEDELEETESLKDDSSANPPVNDETSLISWTSVRPVVPMLPEFRTAFSLDCSGRLEAPPAEEATSEPAGALMESASPNPLLPEAIGWIDEQLITPQPKTSRDQSGNGLPEDESGDDVAFAAEITRAEMDDSSSVEAALVRKTPDAKGELLRQSLPEHRNPGGDRDRQHTAEPPPQRIDSHSEAAVVTPKIDFESITRAEPRRDAPHVATTPPLVEAAEPLQQPPAIAQQPLRDLSMGIVSDQMRVGIQVRESDGTLQVSVRTPDVGVSVALQQNLDELAATLSMQGMDAQFWTPAEDRRIETNAFDGAADSGQSSPDWQGRGNGSQDSGAQHRQNQRSRAGWLDTFSTEQDAETKENEVTSWPFTSQTFQTRR